MKFILGYENEGFEMIMEVYYKNCKLSKKKILCGIKSGSAFLFNYSCFTYTKISPYS